MMMNTASRTTFRLSMLLLGLMASGCTRAYHRQQADGEVYDLLAHGVRDPRWDIERLSIQPDPRARFYDEDCPDHPPMPPDDPTSHQMMHCVDCKAGWPCWHSHGDKPYVENPNFENYLPYDDKGVVVINREGAIELALVNSPGYQNNLETLYLSALDVTFERFAFDTQFFAGNETSFTHLGRVAGNGRSRSTLRTDTDLRARRLFSTGGELIVNVANSFVWQFSGNNSESVNTLLDATFVQPLLRQAGRDTFLERLTQQERQLLGNIRAMQRYRQGFYVNVVTGTNLPPGPTRQGSFFNQAGVFGVTSVQAGGGAGGGGNQVAAQGGIGAAQAGGYLGLLQDARQIANQRSNVDGLRRSLELLEALYDANRIDRLQVDQARQQLFNSQSQLLTAETSYQAALDNFKNTLGLPPCIPIRLEDPLLDQFELLGPDMVALQNKATAMQARLAAPANGNGAAVLQEQQQVAGDLDTLRDAAELLHVSQTLVPLGAGPLQPLRDRFRIFESRLEELEAYGSGLARAIQQLRSYPAAMDLAKELQQSAQEEVASVEASLELLRSRADDRIESLQDLSQREVVRSGDVDVRAFDVEAFRKRLQELPTEYAQLDRRLDAPLARWDNRKRQLDAQRATLESLLQRFSQLLNPLRTAVQRLKVEFEKPGQLTLPAEAQAFLNELLRLADDPQREVERLGADLQRLQELLNAVFQEANVLAQDATDLGLVQARARLEATRLIPIDLESCTAFGVAQQNRLDLMNARANLVDAWRLIQFRADALKSGLEVEFNGQLNTLGDNPFRFRSPTGVLRAAVRFDSPITRLTERNVYRQELINYQRARRSFISFNDGIDRGLRNILRTIELNQVNFELRRAAVQVAIQQVQLAALRLQEPPRPGVLVATLGATTANDLINALTGLLTAQNAYLGVFVNYEVLRMQLDLELGTLLLDPHGLWIDPGEITKDMYGSCDSDEGFGPESIPAPAPNGAEDITPPDISTLILSPSDEELGKAQPIPHPAPAAKGSGPQSELSEPRRLSAEAIESAKAVPLAKPNWSTPPALPASGWKPAQAGPKPE